MTAIAKTRSISGEVVFLLAVLTAMGSLSVDSYLPSLPAMGADLNASAAQAQSTVSTFLAGMAVGQFIYGPTADRLGRKPPLIAGLAVYAAASVVCAMATSPGVLIAARFIQAVGACAGQVIPRAMVRDRFNHVETARMLSLMTLIMGVAPIIAPLFGGLLLGFGGWRANFAAMIVLGVALVLAVWLRMEETRSEETAAHARSEHPVRAYLSLLRERRLIGFAMAGALNGAVLFTYVASAPDLLIRIYGIPPSRFGLFFGMNGVAIIFANWANRRLLKRTTPERVLQVASVVGVICALGLVAAAVTGFGERWVLLPMIQLTLGSYAFMVSNTMAGALNVDPKRAGSISALLGGLSFGVGAFASWVSGALHDGTPRPMAFVMLTGMVTSALSLWLVALPARRRAPQV